MTEWRMLDTEGQYETYQWQRKDGDSYEMYQIVPYPDYAERSGFYYGGGTFRIADYPKAEVE